MAEVTLQQLVVALPEFFVPERAKGADYQVQFNATGEKGGQWTVTIRDQNISVQPGAAAKPDLALTASAQDVLDMFSGTLDPIRAYMRGRVKLQGSMSLAMKLSRFFDVDLNRLRSIGQE